ncbi:unnamed protein product [Prorocentrum cordatum]|uniref:Right handed beta helix domain-containing protein n=1 Tax=Prorocentrum cordatum TaxID=2364126 RepID=A0ABN9QLK2_9DINO|nr:unnamed protein product [Polarella glacialis]
MVQSSQLQVCACAAFRPSNSGCGRSGLALFGDASALVDGCTVEACAIHGCCARGRTRLVLQGCEVAGCGRRGVYADHGTRNNTLEMFECSVHGTQDASRAAVEAAGARQGDLVVARIRRCRVFGNVGAAIRLRGAVEHALEGNSCSGSAHGEVHLLPGEENLEWPRESRDAG